VTTSTGSYQINPTAVNSIVSNVASTASSTGSTVGGLASTVLDAASFATIGSTVASANNTLQNNLVKGLQSIVQLLQTINQNVGTASNAYAAADTAVAQGYGATAGTTPATTTAATPPATAATTTAATTADPNAPLTAAQLNQDQALRNRIMQEEDPHDGTPLNQVYNDTNGHPTVGHGFNLDQQGAAAQLAAVGANYNDIRNGTATLTDDQMNQLLTNHINTAVTTAQNYYSGFDQLDPTRQRVLTDMAYNMGGGTLGQFTGVHQALVNGDYNQAANNMAASLWARQTGTRATSLVQSMRTGTGY
jgi:GH24 family phage-related lysozyme (muramidase)